jgi:hypothetical protein
VVWDGALTLVKGILILELRVNILTPGQFSLHSSVKVAKVLSLSDLNLNP